MTAILLSIKMEKKSIYENPTKNKVGFDFIGSLPSYTGNLGCDCDHDFQK